MMKSNHGGGYYGYFDCDVCTPWAETDHAVRTVVLVQTFLVHFCVGALEVAK